MILVDTGVLVALSEPRDRWHTRAVEELNRLAGPFGVIDAVLVEALFLLRASYMRRRVQFVLERMRAEHVAIDASRWPTVFDWLEKYTEHTPDLCDAILVNSPGAVWTFDSEFATTWRRMDGSMVPRVNAQ